MREFRLRKRRGATRLGEDPGGSDDMAGRGECIATDVPPGESDRPEEARSRHCGASGWHMRLGCTDGSGSAVCPRCNQVVDTRADSVVGGPVRVIQDHVVWV